VELLHRCRSLKDCEFDDVRTGVAGHIKEQSGSLRSGRGSAPGSPQPAHIRRMQSEEVPHALSRSMFDSAVQARNARTHSSMRRTQSTLFRTYTNQARDEQLVVSATECRRGTIKLWSYGEVGRDLIRIGCHLPFQPPCVSAIHLLAIHGDHTKLCSHSTRAATVSVSLPFVAGRSFHRHRHPLCCYLRLTAQQLAQLGTR